MSTFRVWVLVSLVCFSGWFLTGCARGETAGSKPKVTPIEAVGVGEAVDIGHDSSVTMVSSDTSVPVSADSSPQPSPHWILFEVKNSGDTSTTLPSRPVRPTVVDADGNRLDVHGISAQLIDGGGGWGPAAPHLGPPYVNPGGMMRVWCELPALPTAKRPLTVTYAPIRQEEAVFIIE